MKILVLGDAIIDEFIFGDINRQSPEDISIPVVDITKKEYRPGGALNVAVNLKSLEPNNEVFISSIISEYTKEQLLKNKNINTDYCFIHEYFKLSHKESLLQLASIRPNEQVELIKTRIIENKNEKQLLRLDNKLKFTDTDLDDYKFCIKNKNLNFNDFDCVVVSNYCKGIISEELICELHNYTKGKIFVDTKDRDLSLWDFKNCILKLNVREYVEAENKDKAETLIMTEGQTGAALLKHDKWVNHYPSYKHIEKPSVIGCGDSFLAGLVVKFLQTLDLEQSIIFANKIGALSCEKFGTATINKSEIE